MCASRKYQISRERFRHHHDDWLVMGFRLQHMYILEAAEQAGVDLPATCRGGICGYVFEPSPSSVSVSENVRTW